MQIPLLDQAGAPARFGTVRLHHGDWRRAWWSWPETCALITDPPYGQSYESNFSSPFDKSKPVEPEKRGLARGVKGDDSTRERDEVMGQAWSVAAVWGPRRLDRIAPWGSEVQAAASLASALRLAGDDAGATVLEATVAEAFGDRIAPREILAHDKGGLGMGDLSIPWKPSWETIAIYGPGWTGSRTNGVLHGSVVGFGASSASNGRKHPNQKPLNVCAELVGKAPNGLAVVDPFAGSGQILLAAALLGRDAYGAELDEVHFATCRELLEAAGVRVLVG